MARNNKQGRLFAGLDGLADQKHLFGDVGVPDDLVGAGQVQEQEQEQEQATFTKQVAPPRGKCPVKLMSGWGNPCPMLGTGCSSPECEGTGNQNQKG